MRVLIKALPYQGRYGSPYPAHSVQDLDEDEARELVRAGIAELHGPQAVETAMFAHPGGRSLEQASAVHAAALAEDAAAKAEEVSFEDSEQKPKRNGKKGG